MHTWMYLKVSGDSFDIEAFRQVAGGNCGGENIPVHHWQMALWNTGARPTKSLIRTRSTQPYRSS